MQIEILTKEDLCVFKKEILDELTKLIKPASGKKEWLRSADVMKMLGISAGTLQNLRISGKLPYKKLNGSLFYSTIEIERMMNND